MKYVTNAAILCAFVVFGILTDGFKNFGKGLSTQYVDFLQAMIGLIFIGWIVSLCVPASKKAAKHSKIVPFKDLK